MRRTYLRGHTNTLKRLFIHAGGFNIGLIMRHMLGIGTPHGRHGRVAPLVGTLLALIAGVQSRSVTLWRLPRRIAAMRGSLAMSVVLIQALNPRHLHHGLLGL